MGASNDSADSQRVIDYAARSALTRCGADRCSIVLQGRGANYRAHAGPEGPADGLDDALKECRTAQRPVRRKD
ncbi:MAG TPA: hypothetical protein VI643_05050, partial [Planctomycetota bacterium]|nr:hypothetical protein [Planctomycetota bacterium]